MVKTRNVDEVTAEANELKKGKRAPATATSTAVGSSLWILLQLAIVLLKLLMILRALLSVSRKALLAVFSAWPIAFAFVKLTVPEPRRC